MKSLQESLFDKDLEKKDISILDIVNRLNKDDLDCIPYDDLDQMLDTLWTVGQQCDIKYLTKHPINMLNNVVVIRPANKYNFYPTWYYFVFRKSHPNALFVANLIGSTGMKGGQRVGYYHWWVNAYASPSYDYDIEIIKKRVEGLGREEYIILDKKTSADLIKQIEKR